MNRLIQTPKNLTRSTNKEETKKTSKQVKPTGNMKMVNGVVVMLPPDEDNATENLTEKEVELALDKKQDAVTLEVDQEDTSTEEVQYVYDSESEEKSNNLAAKVRKENEERAKKAAIETEPNKVGDVVVAKSTSYDDIDLFAAKLEEKDAEESES